MLFLWGLTCSPIASTSRFFPLTLLSSALAGWGLKVGPGSGSVKDTCLIRNVIMICQCVLITYLFKITESWIGSPLELGREGESNK